MTFGGIGAVNTNQTYTSLAVSGVNPLGFVFVSGDTGATNLITAGTWGVQSMVKVKEVQSVGDRWISLWVVANPASAATIAFVGGTFWRSTAFYFVNASQTTIVDSSATSTVTAASAITLTTTVVGNNCWTISCVKDATGGLTYSTNVGVMQLNADAGGLAVSDSEAFVGTGSQSTTMTPGGSRTIAGIIASFAADAPNNTAHNLSLVGAGT